VNAKRVLLAVVAAILLLVGASVAYATNNSAPENTSTGERGVQVAGNEDANEAGEVEDADEPGDFDGPGDTEDDD
jgi:uncharacterized low-complexity protein